MSSAGTRLAPSTEPLKQTALAHLLHALNQPLTGLQCSLELASSAPRSSEQYARTFREGLALTTRMRVLVEAIRELVHSSEAPEATSDFHLNAVLADCVDQLRPVAEARGVRFQVASRDALPVQADPTRVATVLLRTIGAAISLCKEASNLQIKADVEGHSAAVTISWTPGPTAEFSPFSQPELGLVIAQAAWESVGGHWTELREKKRHACTLQFPLAFRLSSCRKQIGDAK